MRFIVDTVDGPEELAPEDVPINFLISAAVAGQAGAVDELCRRAGYENREDMARTLLIQTMQDMASTQIEFTDEEIKAAKIAAGEGSDV